MPLQVVLLGPREVGFREYTDKPLGPGQVRVRTVLSAISHGTEMNYYRGTAPQLHKRRDRGLNLFLEGEPTRAYPRTLGGGGAGKVVEAGRGVKAVAVGDSVWLPGAHRETETVAEEAARVGRLPEGVTPEMAVFTWLGRVALNGVRDAKIGVGDQVAVFGLGTVGLLAAQLARLDGASRVFAVDRVERRLRKAEEHGAVALDTRRVDPSLEVKRKTGGRGVDVAIEASGSYWCLHHAIRCCVSDGRVVTLGFYQGGGSDLYLGEEWHHNHPSVMTSSRGNLPRGPGWDSARVIATLMELFRERRLLVEDLITHRFSFREAAKAYELLDKRPEETIKVVLEF